MCGEDSISLPGPLANSRAHAVVCPRLRQTSAARFSQFSSLSLPSSIKRLMTLRLQTLSSIRRIMCICSRHQRGQLRESTSLAHFVRFVSDPLIRGVGSQMRRVNLRRCCCHGDFRQSGCFALQKYSSSSTSVSYGVGGLPAHYFDDDRPADARAVHMVKDLALALADHDLLSAAFSRDLTRPFCFLEIAEDFKRTGKTDTAFAWAEQGSAKFPSVRDCRLVDFLVGAYPKRKRHADARRVAWAFTRAPHWVHTGDCSRPPARCATGPDARDETASWLSRACDGVKSGSYLVADRNPSRRGRCEAGARRGTQGRQPGTFVAATCACLRSRASAGRDRSIPFACRAGGAARQQPRKCRRCRNDPDRRALECAPRVEVGVRRLCGRSARPAQGYAQLHEGTG